MRLATASQKGWFVALALWLCFPVGIWLLWRQPDWPHRTKRLITIWVIGILVGGAGISGIYSLTPAGRMEAAREAASKAAEPIAPATDDQPAAVRQFPELTKFPALVPVVDGQTSDDPPIARLKSFAYVPDTGQAVVEVNMDQNLTQSSTNNGVKILVSDIYIALYHGGGPALNSAVVRIYGPLVDKYGNTTQDLVYGTKMPASEASKVNWGEDKAILEFNILPGIWTVFYNFKDTFGGGATT